jgi:site-specific recombinase XerD
MTYENDEAIRATVSQFIQERKYLKNVTPKTLAWYGHSFKAFEGALDSLENVKSRITALRDRGVRAVSVNTYLRCVNAYFKWREIDWRLPRLKEERRILATFNQQHVKALISFKPTGTNERRVYALAMLILDCGLRINEARTLTPPEIDLDNMLITVHGKGRKDRKAPLSFEVRRILYNHMKATPRQYVFGTKRNTACTTRNLQRDLAVVCKKLGITGVRCSWHTLRHTFAVSYLRAGGNIYYVSRILGHSSIKTTEIYLRSLGIEDLQAVHNKLSLLSKCS